METKLCKRLNHEVPITLFNTNPKTGKVHSWCKICVKDYDHERHKNQRTKIMAQKKIRKQDINNWYMELKSKLECSLCPESHPACLTFHHTDPTTKETEVAQAVAWHWSKERILKEIEKCIVLCFNCHAKHHFGEKWNEYL